MIFGDHKPKLIGIGDTINLTLKINMALYAAALSKIN